MRLWDLAAELERELAEARERLISADQLISSQGIRLMEAEAQAEEIERLRSVLQSTFESLTHMKSCRECAEDDWVGCEGGRAAHVALEQAEEALAAQNPGERMVPRSHLVAAREFITAMQGLCGKNLMVYGWHLNGDPMPFDNMIEEELPDVAAIDAELERTK